MQASSEKCFHFKEVCKKYSKQMEISALLAANLRHPHIKEGW